MSRATKTCACGETIGATSTVCRTCAQDINVKYVPTEEEVWAEATAIREAWMFGEPNDKWRPKNGWGGRGDKAAVRPRGGFLAESDEAEKAYRRGLVEVEEEQFTKGDCDD